MDNSAVNLPSGFELEQSQQSSNLPPGFELEGQDSPSSYWQDVGHNAIGELKNMVPTKDGVMNQYKTISALTKPLTGEIPSIEDIKTAGTGIKNDATGMAQSMGNTIMHPIDSFRQKPIETAGNVASIFGGMLGAGGKAAPILADAADSGATALARRSLGMTKRFLNTEGNEMNANSAARSALENKVITPTADAYTMRNRASALAQNSGQQIGDFLNRANEAPVNAEQQSTTPSKPLLLPAPGQASPVQGPENVSTTIGIPAYGGPGSYQYKAAGEGPQFESQGGTLAYPVNQPETFNKNALNDVRNGKLDSNLPPQNIVSPPAPREGWLFDPQKAIADIDNLRPKAKGGKILTGGDYDAQHDVINNALQMIQAHGDRPITWDEANQLKGDLQGTVNYDTSKSSNVNSLKKKIASTFLKNLDSQIDQTMADKGGDSSIFKGAKKTYGESQSMLKGLQNRISSDQGNNAISLTDYATGGIGGIIGHGAGPAGGIIGSMGAIAGKKLLQKYGTNTAATGLFKASKMLRNIKETPTISGPMIAGGQLTRDKAKEYLQKADGDKDKARQLARADGWNF